MMILQFIATIALATLTDCACSPNNICQQQRDLIEHSEKTITPLERVLFRQRTWEISNEGGGRNILLVFKNFETLPTTPVTIQTISIFGQIELKQYSGKLGNFEIILENIRQMVIFVSISEESSAKFSLQYYAGCKVAHGNNMQYPSQIEDPNNPTKCWIVAPQLLGDRKRFYFTFRDVIVADQTNLRLWDAHTNEEIGSITEDTKFEVFAAEALLRNQSQTFIIEFTCNELSTCDTRHNSFYATYYAMAGNEVECIQIQQLCGLHARNMPAELCDVPCPAFERMLEQEYLMENNVPLLKSGGNRRQQTPGCKLVRYRRFCDCPRDTELVGFCYTPKLCWEFGNCAWACIFMKVTQCTHVKVLRAVQLL